MKILAIETSCDDTGISIIKAPKKKGSSFNVLSNIVSSQIEIHKKYGGVYPMLAKREHQKNLLSILTKALKEAKLLKTKNKVPTCAGRQKINSKIIKNILEQEPELYKKTITFLQKYKNPNTCPEHNRRIDLIAVTNGPGLEPCLWVGINFAKALSFFWNIPVVSVNHIESHILVNYLNNPATAGPRCGGVKLPAVCLIVSGGHTQLILMKGIGKYEILGETRDDAAGECFDKCARILGLGYPGGPIISKLANRKNRDPISIKNRDRVSIFSVRLPRPMIGTKDYDFSFSGLKTAVLYLHKKQSKKTQKSKKYIIQMCFEIQQAIIDVLLKKTMKATKDYKAKTIILGGGVSANKELRKQFQLVVNRHCEESRRAGRRSNLTLIFPEPNLSTDNALMTAIAGYFRFKNGKREEWKKIKADGNLRIE